MKLQPYYPLGGDLEILELRRKAKNNHEWIYRYEEDTNRGGEGDFDFYGDYGVWFADDAGLCSEFMV